MFRIGNIVRAALIALLCFVFTRAFTRLGARTRSDFAQKALGINPAFTAGISFCFYFSTALASPTMAISLAIAGVAPYVLNRDIEGPYMFIQWYRNVRNWLTRKGKAKIKVVVGNKKAA